MIRVISYQESVNSILHLGHSEYPPLYEYFPTKYFWKELSKYFEQYVVVGRFRENKFKHFHDGNIDVYLLPKLHNSASFALTGHIAERIIHKHKIDAIFAQDPIFSGVPAVNIGKLHKKPIMIEIHADLYFKPVECMSFPEKLMRRITLSVLNNCTCIRIISETFRDDLIKLGISNEKIKLIPNRVDLKVFDYHITDDYIKKKLSIPDDANIIITVGRFVPQKGYEYLIKSFFLVLKKNPNSYLLIAGFGGPLENKYRGLIKDLGLEEKVHIVKWLNSSTDLAKFLSMGTIYVQPSIPFMGEAMPRTILEAMAMKKAIIATPIGGIPGVLKHRENAFFVPPGDIRALADSIIYLIENRDTRIKIAENAYNDAVNKYEWHKIFKIFADTLKELSVR